MASSTGPFPKGVDAIIVDYSDIDELLHERIKKLGANNVLVFGRYRDKSKNWRRSGCWGLIVQAEKQGPDYKKEEDWFLKQVEFLGEELEWVYEHEPKAIEEQYWGALYYKYKHLLLLCKGKGKEPKKVWEGPKVGLKGDSSSDKKDG